MPKTNIKYFGLEIGEKKKGLYKRHFVIDIYFRKKKSKNDYFSLLYVPAIFYRNQREPVG